MSEGDFVENGIAAGFQGKKEGKFDYIETLPGHPHTLLLLHGIFGAMSNFKCVLRDFSDRINIVIPQLPVYTMPIHKVNVVGLSEFVTQFIEMKGYGKVNILGNSAGGHIALLYALRHGEHVQSITLTGSSGLYENVLGSTFPKRGDYNYIREMSIKVFYDTTLATKEMVDEVYDVVNNRSQALRVLHIAKSAMRHNLADKLHSVEAPVLLVWGRNDTITPPFVAEKFNELIPHTTLKWIDACGHAPMMEKPDAFNTHLEEFLKERRVLD